MSSSVLDLLLLLLLLVPYLANSILRTRRSVGVPRINPLMPTNLDDLSDSEAETATVAERYVPSSMEWRCTAGGWACLDTRFSCDHVWEHGVKDSNNEFVCEFEWQGMPTLNDMEIRLNAVSVSMSSVQVVKKKVKTFFLGTQIEETVVPSPVLTRVEVQCSNEISKKSFSAPVAFQDVFPYSAPALPRHNMGALEVKDIAKTFMTSVQERQYAFLGPQRLAVGNPRHIHCKLIVTSPERFNVVGSVKFIRDPKLEDQNKDLLKLKEIGWSPIKGDANVGFEYESYFVEWILDGVDKTKGVQTKEILFRDIGFDLTADQKVAEENSAWYDLEAVTMPFPSDSGKKWCEVAVRMRKVFETMRRRLQGPIESIQHSHTTVPTDMKIKKFRQDTKQVEILSKKLLGEHHRLKIDPVVKAVFPSPIVMGVNSNYEEFSKLDIVKQYGILGRPQFTLSIRKERLLHFFVNQDGLRDTPLIRSIFHDLSYSNNVVVTNRRDPLNLKRVEQVLGHDISSLRPNQENVIQVEGETFTLNHENDDLKAFLFALRMSLLKLHVKRRKGLYLKAYFAVMFRTSLVSWWESMKKPSGFTIEHVSKIVCDSREMALMMKNEYHYDFARKEYYSADLANLENAIILNPSFWKLNKVIQTLKKGSSTLRITKAAGGSRQSYSILEHQDHIGILTLSMQNNEMTKTFTENDALVVDISVMNGLLYDRRESIRVRDEMFLILKKMSSTGIFENPSPKVFDQKSAHTDEGTCYDWITNMDLDLGRSHDIIADKTEGDESWGYIHDLDALYDMKSSGNLYNTGVRFEIRSWLGVIGPSGNAGVTIDEFLLEASNMVEFAEWLNSGDRTEMQSVHGIPHSFWSTGLIHDVGSSPSLLQLENLEHPSFLSVSAEERRGTTYHELKDDARRERAKKAADLVFETRQSCEHSFARFDIDTSVSPVLPDLEDIVKSSKSKTSTEHVLSLALQRECKLESVVDGNDLKRVHPSSFEDVQDQEERSRIILEAVRYCKVLYADNDDDDDDDGESTNLEALIEILKQRTKRELDEYLKEQTLKIDELRRFINFDDSKQGILNDLFNFYKGSKDMTAALMIHFAQKPIFTQDGPEGLDILSTIGEAHELEGDYLDRSGFDTKDHNPHSEAEMLLPSHTSDPGDEDFETGINRALGLARWIQHAQLERASSVDSDDAPFLTPTHTP